MEEGDGDSRRRVHCHLMQRYLDDLLRQRFSLGSIMKME